MKNATPIKSAIQHPPPSPSATLTRKDEGNLIHVLSTIGLYTSIFDNVIVAQDMNHIAALESITKYQMKDMSSMEKVDTIMIILA